MRLPGTRRRRRRPLAFADVSDRPLRLLVVSTPPPVKRLPALFAGLLDAGVELVFSLPPDGLPARIRQHPRASATTLPLERPGEAGQAIRLLRAAADFTRFLDPALEAGQWPRRRAARRVLKLAGHRQSRALAPRTAELRLPAEAFAQLRAAFRSIERLLPPERDLEQAVAGLDVDGILLVSRCLMGGPEPDVIKVARRLGLLSIMLVWSWDNLSSKAVLNEHPDHLLVWNEIQAREAVDFHGVEAERILALGAANFDRFFDELEAARAAAPERADAAPRTILYLGSSPKVAPAEVPIFERWLGAVRASADPVVRDARVVVRPHPVGRGWGAWSPPDALVSLVEPEAKLEPARLADLLAVADAVAALNTSAEIEAAIAGVPVVTFRAGDDARGQEGSVHFRYLLEQDGGFVVDSGTLDEHVARLGQVLRGGHEREPIRRFVERFVRPGGITLPVVPVVAAKVVELATAGTSRDGDHAGSPPPRQEPGASGRPSRILVVAPRDHVHALPAIFEELLAAGAELAFSGRNPAKLERAVAALGARAVSVVDLPLARTGPDAEAVSLLRAASDLVLLLHPELEDARWARVRGAKRLLKAARMPDAKARASSFADLAVPARVQASLAGALRHVERLVPPEPGLRESIERVGADAVFLVSRCSISGPEPDVLKVARALGLPSAMLVFSWDNLSSKAVLNEHPDRLLVWNRLQVEEAASLHGIPPGSVTVVGAPNFDRFFAELQNAAARLPVAGGSGPREILYLGSSKASTDEPALFTRWLAALRSAGDPVLERARVVLRPHPGSTELWSRWTPPDDPLLSQQPASKREPATLARALSTAHVAVGLSTTAEIEAAIAGRPVVTFRAGADAPAQAGLKHFYYLLEEHGGFVVDSRTLPEHVRVLGRVLRGEYDREAIRSFVERFVRPRGLDRPVAPAVAAAVLELAGAGEPAAVELV